LLRRRLHRERSNLIENNIRFRCIGDIDLLPKATRKEVDKTIEETANCTGMQLTFALSYGGQQEIVLAAKKFAEQVKSGALKIEDLNEESFRSLLPSNFIPDPDLILRTSGESRISNFFLWQAAYAEILVTPKMWPDFQIEDLQWALQKFYQTERRFGRISEQLNRSVAESSLAKMKSLL
ncbi:MAG: di-trans,poly-cis-decaprenylcistransferase, partial [Bdellovibrionales bacterium]|nr:di-trans,poly-cis-decaprenylcistransferase [Bdellovibrionales bacterium]